MFPRNQRYSQIFKRWSVKLILFLALVPLLLSAQGFQSLGAMAGVGYQKYDRLYFKAAPFWQDQSTVWQVSALANLGLNDNPYEGDSSMGELDLLYGKYIFISGLYLSASTGVSYIVVEKSNPGKTLRGIGIPFEVQVFLQNPVAGLGVIAHANVNAHYSNFSFVFCAKLGLMRLKKLSAPK